VVIVMATVLNAKRVAVPLRARGQSKIVSAAKAGKTAKRKSGAAQAFSDHQSTMSAGGRPNPTKWTEALMMQLIRLHVQGLSHEGVGKEMGIGRGAVSGKINRLGLVVMHRPSTDELVIWARRLANEFAAEIYGAAKGEPEVEHIDVDPHVAAAAFVSRQNTARVLALKDADCRWPYGDIRQAGFHFCCNQVVSGTSYCAVHNARSVQPKVVRNSGSTAAACADNEDLPALPTKALTPTPPAAAERANRQRDLRRNLSLPRTLERAS
jgi:hypothetical protein